MRSTSSVFALLVGSFVFAAANSNLPFDPTLTANERENICNGLNILTCIENNMDRTNCDGNGGVAVNPNWTSLQAAPGANEPGDLITKGKLKQGADAATESLGPRPGDLPYDIITFDNNTIGPNLFNSWSTNMMLLIGTMYHEGYHIGDNTAGFTDRECAAYGQEILFLQCLLAQSDAFFRDCFGENCTDGHLRALRAQIQNQIRNAERQRTDLGCGPVD